MYLKWVFIFSLFFSMNAYADDDTHTYAPDFCEFSVTFPSVPHKTKKCEDNEGKKQCYEQISFTQVYQLDATVDFKVICNKINQGIKDQYSGEVMEATLRAMTKGHVVETFDTSFREEKNYKQAGLAGEGIMGMTPTIYIAQIWIGEKSALSVEAELTGEEHADADKIFGDILRSVRYKESAPLPKESEKETKENQSIP